MVYGLLIGLVLFVNMRKGWVFVFLLGHFCSASCSSIAFLLAYVFELLWTCLTC